MSQEQHKLLVPQFADVFSQPGQTLASAPKQALLGAFDDTLGLAPPPPPSQLQQQQPGQLILSGSLLMQQDLKDYPLDESLASLDDDDDDDLTSRDMDRSASDRSEVDLDEMRDECASAHGRTGKRTRKPSAKKLEAQECNIGFDCDNEADGAGHTVENASGASIKKTNSGSNKNNSKKRKAKQTAAESAAKKNKNGVDVSRYPHHFRSERKPRRAFWTPKEVAAMLKGVSRHGKGRWVLIKNDPELGPQLKMRTTVDIKDKWRNYQKDKAKQRGGKPSESLVERDPKALRGATAPRAQMGALILERDQRQFREEDLFNPNRLNTLDQSERVQLKERPGDREDQALLERQEKQGIKMVDGIPVKTIRLQLLHPYKFDASRLKPGYANVANIVQPIHVSLDSRVSDIRDFVSSHWLQNYHHDPRSYCFYLDTTRLDNSDNVIERGVTTGSTLYIDVPVLE